LLVWLTFGAVAVVPAVEGLNWQIVLYAVLSLTVVRMAPVAAALVGARLGRATVALLGWFGPPGLASVVFALLALHARGSRWAGRVGGVLPIAVSLSVIIPGARAEPLAVRYARQLARSPEADAPAGLSDIPDRRLIRGAASPDR